MTEGVYQPLKDAVASLSDEGDEVLSAVAVWITDNEAVFGFVECVQPKHRERMAKLLREHATALERRVRG